MENSNLVSVVAVIGATGRTGKHVVKKLLQKNIPVRILVRNVSKAKELFGLNDNLELVEGDILNKESLKKVISGTSHVINAAGGFSLFGLGALTGYKGHPYYVDFEGTVKLCDVCKESSSSPYLIVVSSLAVSRTISFIKTFLNVIAGNVMYWKFKGEEVVRKSGLKYTIIRPGGLTDESGGSSQIVIGQGDTLGGRITREDVAEVCLQCFNSPAVQNTTFEVVSRVSPNPNNNFQYLFASLKPDS